MRKKVFAVPESTAAMGEMTLLALAWLGQQTLPIFT